MDAAAAFAVFLASFTEVPSRRAVSRRSQAGPLPVVHSDYLWHGERRVTDDFFVHGVAPDAALAAVAAHRPAPLHYLLVVEDGPETLAAYAAGGYRLSFTEYLMARGLEDLPAPDATREVRLIRSDAEAALANALDAEREPWIRPANLVSPDIWHCAVIDGGATAARARAWRYGPAGSYVTHVFTHPDHRRRGLARAVMLRLLHDAAARGERVSALVASEEGDLLYRSLGYARLVRLLVLEPDQPTAGGLAR